MKCKPISKHEYFFPFSWRGTQHKHRENKIDHHLIEHTLLRSLHTWREVTQVEESEKYYNERIYFYPPVQEVLYQNEKNTLLKVYVKERTSEEDCLIIEGNRGVYELPLRNIQLKLYRTGVGILSFVLLNDKEDDLESIIAINAISKCVYPYRLPLEEIHKDFFPKALTIKICDRGVKETFDNNYKCERYTVNNCLLFMLGSSFGLEIDEYNHKLCIEPLMNNRMFVLCTYANKALFQQIKNNQLEEKIFNQFINFSFKEKGAQQHQIKLPNVIYSIGRFSMIAITSPEENIYSYNQLITLALVQRTSILHFSNQVAYISALDKQDLIYAIRRMYEIYIQFTTRIYFEEVTVDVEGTRIYNDLMEQLQVEKELKQLDFEMQEIHEYAMLIEKNQARNRVDFLTIVGAALVIPTFVTGFFGMNILQDKFLNWWEHKEIALWFNSYVLVPILVVLLFYSWGGRKSSRLKVQRVLLIIILVISIGVGVIMGCGLQQ